MSSIFRSPTTRQTSIAIALLRFVLGLTFVIHGGQKLFVFGFSGVTGAFGQMGIPMAGVLGPFVALVEFFGGIAILLGLLTRVAALGIAGTMLVAILTVHLKAGFFNPNGVEFPLALLGMAIALVTTGAGALSLDALLDKRLTRADRRRAVAPEVVRERRAA